MVQHVLGVEQGYWETDGVMEKVQDPFAIDIDDAADDNEGLILVSLSDEDWIKD